ncbi:MAG: tyrosine-protein phosphatase [Saccharofermentans sp.]|nr:tyrosine-protein phosphatase [Saccharofermentans sp.]
MNTYNPDNQRLFFDDLINCRELGGMPLTGGKVFKSGIALRSGSPSLASSKAHELLKQYGVKTVIDLRSAAEVKNYGNPFEKDEETKYVNIPLFVGDPDLKEDPTMVFLETHPMGDFYIMVLQELGKEIVEVMRVIAENNDGLILFHCAHGKDRTGIIAALLYLLAGATRENIVLNYKVSYEYAKSFLDPLIEARVENMRHTLRSDASNMEIFLDYIRDKYDMDASKYLIENGMLREEIERLKERIIN